MIIHVLENAFGALLNVEWSEEEDGYEAIFYYGGTEHIARIDGKGVLLEVKANLPLHMVEPPIARRALEVGELMNLIKISRQDKYNFEIIARDKYLDRFYLLLEPDGTLLEKRKL